MKDYFLNITRSLGIRTRIVECAIALEYECVESQEKFLQEYENLGQSSDILNKALQARQKENDVILELLIQLYQKISKIERMLLQDEQVFLRLESKITINALGHGILCAKNGNFAKGSLYYLRFCLPNISGKMIGAFGEALSDEVMKLTSIHTCDIDSLDNYIATQEIEHLRQKRIEQ